MKIKICDVCDSKFEPDERLIEVVIPGEYLWEAEDEDEMRADVCSWNCLQQIVSGASDAGLVPDEEQGEDSGEKDEKLVMIPQKKSPTVGDLTPEELAKYTEQMTGVKRRY